MLFSCTCFCCCVRAVNCVDGPLDVVLILGLWSDVADMFTLRQMWKVLIELARHIVDTLTTSKEVVKIGLITLGDTAKSEFFLSNTHSKWVLIDRINQLPISQSKVTPAAAIRHAREVQFILDSGDRRLAPDLLILLTDQARVLAKAEVVTEVSRASNAGIKVYSIDTDSLNALDLTATIAANPSADRILSGDTQTRSLERTLAAMKCSTKFGGSRSQLPGMLVPTYL